MSEKQRNEAHLTEGWRCPLRLKVLEQPSDQEGWRQTSRYRHAQALLIVSEAIAFAALEVDDVSPQNLIQLATSHIEKCAAVVQLSAEDVFSDFSIAQTAIGWIIGSANCDKWSDAFKRMIFTSFASFVTSESSRDAVRHGKQQLSGPDGFCCAACGSKELHCSQAVVLFSVETHEYPRVDWWKVNIRHDIDLYSLILDHKAFLADTTNADTAQDARCLGAILAGETCFLNVQLTVWAAHLFPYLLMRAHRGCWKLYSDLYVEIKRQEPSAKFELDRLEIDPLETFNAGFVASEMERGIPTVINLAYTLHCLEDALVRKPPRFEHGRVRSRVLETIPEWILTRSPLSFERLDWEHGSTNPEWVASLGARWVVSTREVARALESGQASLTRARENWVSWQIHTDSEDDQPRRSTRHSAKRPRPDPTPESSSLSRNEVAAADKHEDRLAEIASFVARLRYDNRLLSRRATVCEAANTIAWVLQDGNITKAAPLTHIVAWTMDWLEDQSRGIELKSSYERISKLFGDSKWCLVSARRFVDELYDEGFEGASFVVRDLIHTFEEFLALGGDTSVLDGLTETRMRDLEQRTPR